MGIFIMEEIWKDIAGYEGLYQISNFGTIKSLSREFYQPDRFGSIYKNRTRNKILINNLSKKGYWCISLTKNAQRKQFYVHRLIANAFIPKVEGKNYINHINGIKTDNRIENLEWCTISENNTHYWRVLKKRPKREGKKLHTNYCSRACIRISQNGEIKKYKCVKEAEIENKIASSSIIAVCKKAIRQGYERKTAGGYKWEYDAFGKQHRT